MHTAKQLKEILSDTLSRLQSKKITVREADAIAQQSREIIRVINSQKEICTYTKTTLPEELIDYATK